MLAHKIKTKGQAMPEHLKDDPNSPEFNKYLHSFVAEKMYANQTNTIKDLAGRAVRYYLD